MLTERWSWLPNGLALRLARTYGSQTEKIIGDAQSLSDLGQLFGHNLYEAELRYLVQHEWVITAEDALWRRTKLGMWLTQEEQLQVEQWLRREEQ